ncbi:hypothetical protein A1O3_07560 [Capronia epimyces CBS 606.96]|uniref:DUF7892 domain-containing protein n=1 Tax=Capronia epimyces CBS 606.96 TaxID=1182542 RepID=W9XV92_9EURO|nr:uncharacterized protein A1O3_07560 [Capronia epimyces CBS 606.96]EXJ81270.1 hypothetical protein A1O3_07560 [Capronia epimyces CBS 606.96]
MDAFAPPARPRAKGKRKYEHEPFMRVGSSFINSDSSSYEATGSKSSDHGKVVSQSSVLLTGQSVDNTARDCTRSPVSTVSRSRAEAPANGFTFVISTSDDFKFGQRSSLGRSDHQSSLSLRDRGPAEKRRRLSNLTQPDQRPTLKPSRPIANSDQVNSDVWQTILGYCEPKLLLEVKTLNSAFNRLLSDRSAIWKASRQNHFGPDMPDCPPGLTEQQYVDLLAGRGCQSSTCPNENTARVFWTFQVRLCARCFKERTVRADELPLQRRHSIPLWKEEDSVKAAMELWELLPMAWSDGRRYMRPRSVDETANGWRAESNSSHFTFLKSSYATLEAEYIDLLSHSPTGGGAVKEWVDGIHKQTMAFMAQVKNTETWFKSQSTPDKDLQQVRIDFFEARAAQLSPPLQSQMLWNMAAFRRVVRVPQAPSERSWNTLKAKILPYQAQAAQVEIFKAAMARDSFPQICPNIKLFQRLHDHRSGRNKSCRSLQSEQAFVLRLGREQFARCVQDKVADADLLLLCLKRVYDAYEQRKETGGCPVGLNYDGSTGPYVLTLDDARMIVKDVLMEEISPRSQRGETVFRSLRCRGCRRSDFVKTWNFSGAFEHMLTAHAQQVGEGLEFWRFAIPYGTWKPPDNEDEPYRFPWYRVPWPKCLPLAPVHQDTRELEPWHPDSAEPYRPLEIRTTVSAFAGRRPRQNDIPDTDFAGNLIFAASTLRGVRVDGSCQMKIALKYAMDRYAATSATEAPLSMFRDGVEGVRQANPAIDLRFRCGVCVGDEDIIQSAKHVKYRVPVEALVIHWKEKHQGGEANWGQGLMCLPSDSEVMAQIAESDQSLQQEKELAKARAAELPTNVRKRPKLKTSVVLQTRSGSEVLEELFPQETDVLSGDKGSKASPSGDYDGKIEEHADRMIL